MRGHLKIVSRGNECPRRAIPQAWVSCRQMHVDAAGQGAAGVATRTLAGGPQIQLRRLQARTLALHSVPKSPPFAQDISLASP